MKHLKSNDNHSNLKYDIMFQFLFRKVTRESGMIFENQNTHMMHYFGKLNSITQLLVKRISMNITDINKYEYWILTPKRNSEKNWNTRDLIFEEGNDNDALYLGNGFLLVYWARESCARNLLSSFSNPNNECYLSPRGSRANASLAATFSVVIPGTTCLHWGFFIALAISKKYSVFTRDNKYSTQ